MPVAKIPTKFTTTSQFVGAPAYIGQRVLLGIDAGSGIQIIPGFITSLDEDFGAGTICIFDPILIEQFGTGLKKQIQNVQLTTNSAALAGDPTALTHWTWMPFSLVTITDPVAINPIVP